MAKKKKGAWNRAFNAATGTFYVVKSMKDLRKYDKKTRKHELFKIVKMK